MDVDRELARLNRLEKPVCYAAAAVLAALYFWWRLREHHVLAIYTWMIPFAIGYAVPLVLFSLRITRLERTTRVPTARVVTTQAQHQPASQRPLGVPSSQPIAAPAHPSPTPGDVPRLLK